MSRVSAVWLTAMGLAAASIGPAWPAPKADYEGGKEDFGSVPDPGPRGQKSDFGSVPDPGPRGPARGRFGGGDPPPATLNPPASPISPLINPHSLFVILSGNDLGHGLSLGAPGRLLKGSQERVGIVRSHRVDH